MSRPARAARVVRAVALVIAAAGLLWALGLAVFGGIDTVIAGRHISSNEPIRPLALAVLGLALFVFANGVTETYGVWTTIAEAVDERWIVGALIAGTFIVGTRYATTAASGTEPYGVVSAAELWFNGHLKAAMPMAQQVPWPSKLWTFIPVGYSPTSNDDPWTIVPDASAGLPILMAAAQRLGGQCAMFLVVPLLGSLAILAIYGVGRRLGWPAAGLVAAWLTATHPAFLEQLVLPTTEIATIAAVALAMYLLLGRRLRSAIAAGLCLAAAIVVRPPVAPLGAIAVAWLFARDWSDASLTFARRLRDASVFAVFAAAGALAAAVYAQFLYGTTIAPGDASLLDSLAWSHALIWPWLAVAAGIAVTVIAKAGRPGLTLAVVGTVAWIGVYDLRLAARHGTFDRWRADRAAIAVARLVADRTPANGVVLTLANSGSVRYYAGRVTLRWDLLDPDWLDRAVAWLSDHGFPPYAVLDDAEAAVFRERFATQRTARMIDTPQVVYQGAARLRFYDLGRVPAASTSAETVVESFRDPMRCVPPAPAPRLVFER